MPYDKKADAISIKRVLFITDALTPSGSTNYLLDISEALIQKGVECLVLSGGGQDHLFKRLNIPVKIIGGLYSSLGRLFVWPRTIREVREFNPTVIHAQHIASVPVANRLRQALNCPTMLSIHHFIGRNSLAKYLRGKVVAISEALRQHLVNQTGIPKEMIRVVHDGVDMKRYRLPPSRDFNLYRPVIGVTGKLIAQKGQEYFLRAARLVLDTGLDAEFVVAGVGKDITRLRKLAKELDLQKNLTFTQGDPPDRDTIELFDILVHTSLEEGLGLHIIEGMALGKPVVATGSGGIFALVKDDETGLLVPPKNPQMLAEKILYLIENPVIRREMGLAAREFVSKEFSLNKTVEQLLAVYRETCLLHPNLLP